MRTHEGASDEAATAGLSAVTSIVTTAHDAEFNDRRLVEVYDAESPWARDDDYFLALVDETSRARVLDAGCGTGRLAIGLAEAGHVVTGFSDNTVNFSHHYHFGSVEALRSDSRLRFRSERQLRSQSSMPASQSSASTVDGAGRLLVPETGS
jgi:hypothetical protein